MAEAYRLLPGQGIAYLGWPGNRFAVYKFDGRQWRSVAYGRGGDPKVYSALMQSSGGVVIPIFMDGEHELVFHGPGAIYSYDMPFMPCPGGDPLADPLGEQWTWYAIESVDGGWVGMWEVIGC